MLVDACMEPEFWGAAMKHAAWVLSRVAHQNDMGKVSNATPYELFYDAGKPDLKLGRKSFWLCSPGPH